MKALETVRIQSRKPIPEAMTMDDIYNIGNSYADPKVKALLFFCYMTGARISEALKVIPLDIAIVKSKKLGNYMTVRLLTRKNKRIPFRDVPVPMRYKEGDMVKYILSFIKVENPGDRESIFGYITRTNAWNKLTKKSVRLRAVHGNEIIDDHEHRINPHYLRHCRLTHLVQQYGYNDIQLMQFAGWSDTRPAAVYVHLNWMDLARVMSSRVERDLLVWD